MRRIFLTILYIIFSYIAVSLTAQTTATTQTVYAQSPLLKYPFNSFFKSTHGVYPDVTSGDSGSAVTPGAAEPSAMPSPEASPVASSPAVASPVSSPTATSGSGMSVRPPNEIGDIMVIMYHGITVGEPTTPYQRSAADFKRDLKRLYDGGFRLISLADLLSNNIRVEAGYTPVVLTFDDGDRTSFSLQKKDGKLVPTDSCAVDIIEKFYEEHKDFGKAAAFFINGSSMTFKGAGTLAESMKYLVDNGFEIGNHTYGHKQLSKLDAAAIQEEIGKIDAQIRANVPGYEPVGLVYPYGERPVEANRSLALSGTYGGNVYKYPVAFRAGPSGASANPVHVNFDPLNAPRVRATETEKTDLGWCFDYYKANPSEKYVSDGDPDTISVPKKLEKKVNKNALGGKTLKLY